MEVFDDLKSPFAGSKETKIETEEKTFEPLSVVLADIKFSIMTTPYIINREKLGEWLIKHLSSEIDIIYTVGWRETTNPFYISFDRLLEKVSVSKNSLFIIEDLVTFTGYAGEIKLSKNNNFFLILVDILTDAYASDTIDKYFPDAIELWPAPLNVPVEVVYNRKPSLIAGGHLKQYNEEYIRWRKLDHSSYGTIENPPDSLFGTLNVYLTKDSPSLESLDKDIAITKSPKFIKIIQSISFHDRKRHFIHMIPGSKGISAFEALYGKISRLPPIHVIKSSDPHRVKEDKIEDINSSNSPLVVVSDYNFTDEMTIKNIDYYHITNGGRVKDIISILSLLKGNNYTGTYPRKLYVNNYVTETPTNDPTVDSVFEQGFANRMRAIMSYEEISKQSDYTVVFVEGILNVVIEA